MWCWRRLEKISWTDRVRNEVIHGAKEEKNIGKLHENLIFYIAETWTLRAADQKYLESFEMWCWRRLEKISWTDRVRNEVIHRAKEEKNIGKLHENLIFYIAETWTLRAADQKYLESFEMWCWRRLEISWTDHVRNEVIHRAKEENNIGKLHENLIFFLVQHEFSTARSFHLLIIMKHVTAQAALNPV